MGESSGMGIDNTLELLCVKFQKIERLKKSYFAGGIMAGSIATFAVLWVFLQTMGLFGPQNTIGAFKLPFTLENYLTYNKGPASWDSEYKPSLVVDTDTYKIKRLPSIDESSLNASVAFAIGTISRIERIEDNLVNSGVLLVLDSPAHQHFLHDRPNDRALEKNLEAVIAIKASIQLSQAHCTRYGLNEHDCAQIISTLPLGSTTVGVSCAIDQDVDCNVESKYRTYDGSCNNIQNPKWGSAFTGYGRLLFPQYADGIQMPRKEQGVRGLPNPRAVSVSLASQCDKVDVSRTLALMQWSQFVSHDIAYTPVRKMIWTGKPISCCRSDDQWPLPRYIHPDCQAISVAENDPIYGKFRVRCLNYVRSLAALRSDCSFGPAEQMNQVSHFLDGSTIYGSTLALAYKLRAYKGGLLRTNTIKNREYLPITELASNSLCKLKNCYLSGDERVNAEPQLAVMHTIWVREHNRVARELAKINPKWSDESLYQEVRRIIIAEIQHITYKEWLPLLIGNHYLRAVGLGITTNYSNSAYSSSSDPSISNEVATAVLRFHESLKQGILRISDNDRNIISSMNLSDYFYKPRSIEINDTFDGLINSLTTQISQQMDLHLISDLTNQLYKTNGTIGLDQISIDIQRGRDHGLPGYNDYRKHCGLRKAKTFDDFLDYIPIETVMKLKDLYKRPDDVDLVIGGMAESSVDDAILGPTFRCLISRQFLKIRRTDRFFYTSIEQPESFTISQLNALEKVTLARIFCDNGDNINRIQPNVFLKQQIGNELRPCTDFQAIPSIDLFAWAEKAKAYR
ncbi:PREDICTED: peroxidase-like [Ceratosolen solmsi marchali]|uniref:Peroxidase-like n=1 Tax=Ceratosolen solmsi marchali TaxID=326594 RepID=A0AAJ6YMT2_9HYME|nr:PREDICTED: peroxidase-like [Ceratosolen solmsi marchali]